MMKRLSVSNCSKRIPTCALADFENQFKLGYQSMLLNPKKQTSASKKSDM